MKETIFEVVIELPIHVSDLFEIQKMLQNNRIICSVFKLPAFNEYLIADYIGEKEIHGTTISALFDRNIFTDIISLARGEEISQTSESKRLVAALMAFLQCADVLIEPNIALYEYASKRGSLIANEELRLFRVADNIHPKIYTDIALSRKNKVRMKKDVDSNIEDGRNFDKQLQSWNFNYTIALKLALFERAPIEQHQKMSKFMKWMFEEFYFGAPAVLFANRYFAYKATMKGLKSFDRKQALSTLKRTTWDLTLLTEWAKKVELQTETNTIWLLCSRDATLMRIARCLMVSGHAESALREEKIKNDFIGNWGNKIGYDLYKIYLHYQQNSDDKSRVANRGFPPKYFKEIQLKFEKDLLKIRVTKEGK